MAQNAVDIPATRHSCAHNLEDDSTNAGKRAKEATTTNSQFKEEGGEAAPGACLFDEPAERTCVCVLDILGKAS